MEAIQGVETGIFRPKSGVTEERLLEAYRAMEADFLRSQPGFRGHKLMKLEDGRYMDLVFADTSAQNHEICGLYLKTKSGLDFLSLLDETSVDMNFWEEVN